jgi:uracil-DNA glycosylase
VPFLLLRIIARAVYGRAYTQRIKEFPFVLRLSKHNKHTKIRFTLLMSTSSQSFKPNCRDCDRLATFLDDTKATYPTYFCKPVPAFGVANPKLLIVGLAPGMHGANRTGRPFTGDYAGELLYSTLHHFGFANQPTTVKDDGARDDRLTLIDCRISNAVKCLPPGNKPLPAEIRECNKYLAAELKTLAPRTAIIALGSIAHESVLMATGMKKSAAKFAHNASHALTSGHQLFDSYHCSRYNTNTKRLTEEAFHDVFRSAKNFIKRGA